MVIYRAQQGISHGDTRIEPGEEVPAWLLKKSPWLVSKGYVQAEERPDPVPVLLEGGEN